MRPDAPLLLDTCAIMYITQAKPIRPEASAAMVEAGESGLLVSPVSAWEIGLLARPGRRRVIDFAPDPLTWFRIFLDRSRAGLAPFSIEIAITASHLPEPLHGDPADRLLIATARSLDACLVTRDKAILDYAALGHVRAIAC